MCKYQNDQMGPNDPTILIIPYLVRPCGDIIIFFGPHEETKLINHTEGSFLII